MIMRMAQNLTTGTKVKVDGTSWVITTSAPFQGTHEYAFTISPLGFGVGRDLILYATDYVEVIA